MRIVVSGTTGMVGQGVLEACLRDDAVTDVLLHLRGGVIRAAKVAAEEWARCRGG